MSFRELRSERLNSEITVAPAIPEPALPCCRAAPPRALPRLEALPTATAPHLEALPLPLAASFAPADFTEIMRALGYPRKLSVSPPGPLRCPSLLPRAVAR